MRVPSSSLKRLTSLLGANLRRIVPWSQRASESRNGAGASPAALARYESIPVISSNAAIISRYLFAIVLVLLLAVVPARPQAPKPAYPIVLHAARLLDIENGRISSPGEILVQGGRIAEVGKTVKHPAGVEIVALGDRTLLPGLIDAHVHLFLHPGAEDLQTVQESVPRRTIMATLSARDDLMAGFTAERDMGTEGAGPADTAVRDAIDRGEIPGPARSHDRRA